MADVPTPTTFFASDELVVELRYQSLITQRIHDLPGAPPVETVTVSHDLDLALLRLSSVEESARLIEDARPQEIAHLRDTLGAEVYRPLDAVVDELRVRMSMDFGGWLPSIGKNRDMSAVIGFPESKSMADTVPHPALPGQWQASANPLAGRGVRIGILDTPPVTHPDLDRHVKVPVGERGHHEPGGLVSPTAGHANFVAGLIVGRAPAAELIVKALLDGGTGRASAWDTAVMMAKFASDGIDVLNLSLGCLTTDGAPPLVMRRAIEVLGTRTLVVAAAGNHGDSLLHPNAPVWPAALSGVVAVGAGEAKFSPQLPWVTCTAPGENLVSTYLSGTVDTGQPEQFHGYATWSGTSFSTAICTGAVAAATVPGKVSAHDALRHLLDTPNQVVTRYTWPPS